MHTRQPRRSKADLHPELERRGQNRGCTGNLASRVWEASKSQALVASLDWLWVENKRQKQEGELGKSKGWEGGISETDTRI